MSASSNRGKITGCRVDAACTGMGTCVSIAPQVFRIDPLTCKARVVTGDFDGHAKGILKSARACPFVIVEVDGMSTAEAFTAATVENVTPLTDHVVELCLRQPGFCGSPGQYIFIELRDHKGVFHRPYSVVGYEKGVIRLVITLYPNGRAGAVVPQLKAGDRVALSAPKGLFCLETTDRPKLFIVGGTGIAPAIPMMKAAIDAPKTLVFGARTSADLFYLDELESIPNTTLKLAAEEPDSGFEGTAGRVTDAMEELELDQFDEIYTSGSPEMVKAVLDLARQKGFPESAVHVDSFEPATPGVVALRPRIDWCWMARRVHAYITMALAAVILFYAVSGFIANRAELFKSESAEVASEGESTERELPDDLELSDETLRSYLLGLLPAGVTEQEFLSDDIFVTASYRQGNSLYEVSLDKEERTVSVEEFTALPADMDLEGRDFEKRVAAWLAQQYSGKVAPSEDEESGDQEADDEEDADEEAGDEEDADEEAGDEEDGDEESDDEDDIDWDEEEDSEEEEEFQIDFESVWGTHSIVIYKEKRAYRVTSTDVHWVTAITNIHRSKHISWAQKIIVDIAAVALALGVITALMFTFTSPSRSRRIEAIILFLVSVGLVIWLLLGR